MTNSLKPGLQLTLRIAGVYNTLWGAWVILFPTSLFSILGMEPPLYPMIWQGVGLVVGVYGVGYWVAAKDYIRHWPIVLVGWLGKLGGPGGIVYHVFYGPLDEGFLLITFLNDIVWWVPFTMMVWAAWKAHRFQS